MLESMRLSYIAEKNCSPLDLDQYAADTEIYHSVVAPIGRLIMDQDDFVQITNSLQCDDTRYLGNGPDVMSLQGTDAVNVRAIQNYFQRYATSDILDSYEDSVLVGSTAFMQWRNMAGTEVTDWHVAAPSEKGRGLFTLETVWYSMTLGYPALPTEFLEGEYPADALQAGRLATKPETLRYKQFQAGTITRHIGARTLQRTPDEPGRRMYFAASYHVPDQKETRD